MSEEIVCYCNKCGKKYVSQAGGGVPGKCNVNGCGGKVIFRCFLAQKPKLPVDPEGIEAF